MRTGRTRPRPARETTFNLKGRRIFIEPSTRKVELAGIAQGANGLWMSQIARNLTDAERGIVTGKRYLIHDRDPLFNDRLLNMIADAGAESVKLPPRSPNLNACAERFVCSIKESSLERMIFFGEESLHTITASAIIRVWRTNGSAQSLRIPATQVRSNAADA